MSMGERHEHMKTPSAYEGVSGVNLCFFRLLLFRLLLPFVLAFSRSPILASSSSRSSVYLRYCTPASANRRLDSVLSHNLLAFV
jgi:hypothetical protein